MNTHANLVILAGGSSSRMKKAASDRSGLSNEEIKQANERNKGLIAMGHEGRPMMDYLLYNSKKAGYQNIYMVIGEQGTLFKEFYGEKDRDNTFHGMRISFATQYVPKDRVKPFGTADALYQAMEQFPELNKTYYSVCNSDNLYSKNALEALRKSTSPNAFIAYDRGSMQFSLERISRFAVTKLDKDGYLLDIIEKPSEDKIECYKDTKGKTRISMNAFKFDGAKIYPYLENCPVHPERNEKELPTALLNMLKDYPQTTIGIPFSEHVPDLTAKEDIVKVNKYLREKHPQLNWE